MKVESSTGVAKSSPRRHPEGQDHITRRQRLQSLNQCFFGDQDHWLGSLVVCPWVPAVVQAPAPRCQCLSVISIGVRVKQWSSGTLQASRLH